MWSADLFTAWIGRDCNGFKFHNMSCYRLIALRLYNYRRLKDFTLSSVRFSGVCPLELWLWLASDDCLAMFWFTKPFPETFYLLIQTINAFVDGWLLYPKRQKSRPVCHVGYEQVMDWNHSRLDRQPRRWCGLLQMRVSVDVVEIVPDYGKLIRRLVRHSSPWKQRNIVQSTVEAWADH